MPLGLSCGKRSTSLGTDNPLLSYQSLTDPFHRNHVPWIVIGVCYVVSIILLMIIRVRIQLDSHVRLCNLGLLQAYLANENRRRDAEPLDTSYDDVYTELLGSDGVMEKVKVEKVHFHRPYQGCLICVDFRVIGILGFDRRSESGVQICIMIMYRITRFRSDRCCPISF